MNESLKSKAETLVSFASVMASGSKDSFCELHPQLRTASRIHMWDFFATVLQVWAALNHIPEDISEESRTRIESIVYSKLTSLHPSGIHALQDIRSLVNHFAKEISDAETKRDLAPMHGGTWLLWNLTERAPINRASGIAATLGKMFVSEFSQYWSVKSESSPSSSKTTLINPVVTQKLRDRAENAPTSYRIVFEAFERIQASKKPHLLLLPHWQGFTGAATIAGCFSLSVCLAHEVPAELRTELEMIMRKHCDSRWPGCSSFWDDLAIFTSDSLLPIPRGERGKYFFLIPALWLVEQLSESEKFDRKDELCGEIALIFQKESVGYWSAVQDYTNN